MLLNILQFLINISPYVFIGTIILIFVAGYFAFKAIDKAMNEKDKNNKI